MTLKNLFWTALGITALVVIVKKMKKSTTPGDVVKKPVKGIINSNTSVVSFSDSGETISTNISIPLVKGTEVEIIGEKELFQVFPCMKAPCPETKVKYYQIGIGKYVRDVFVDVTEYSNVIGMIRGFQYNNVTEPSRIMQKNIYGSFCC